MKDFVQSAKGKIVLLLVTVIVITAAASYIIISNIGYRSIQVQEMNGEVVVTNSGSDYAAYSGQKLKNGDAVDVRMQSSLTLAVDTDKYLFADELTKFHLEAAGRGGVDARTIIHLDNGSVLTRIDNKLSPGEEFSIATPNSTMSVRGTVFGVENKVDASGVSHVTTYVVEGEVTQQMLDESGQPVGEPVAVGEGKSLSYEAEPGKAPEMGIVEDIDYSKLPAAVVDTIGSYMDEGRINTMSREELNDKASGSGSSDASGDKGADEGSSEAGSGAAGQNGGEAEGSGAAADESTSEAAQSAAESSQEPKPASAQAKTPESQTAQPAELQPEAQQPVQPAAVQPAIQQSVVQQPVTQQPAPKPQTQSESDKKSSGKSDKSESKYDCNKSGHVWSPWMEKLPPNCTEEGTGERTCGKCGKKETMSIPVVPSAHVWSTWTEVTPATCTAAGKKQRTCSKCQTEESEALTELGHDWAVDEESPDPSACNDHGTQTFKCQRDGCSETKTHKLIYAEHIWENFNDDNRKHTCSSGEHIYEVTGDKCEFCGAQKDVDIKPEPNWYPVCAGTLKDGECITKYSVKCPECDTIFYSYDSPKDHKFNEDGKCTQCNYYREAE